MHTAVGVARARMNIVVAEVMEADGTLTSIPVSTSGTSMTQTRAVAAGRGADATIGIEECIIVGAGDTMTPVVRAVAVAVTVIVAIVVAGGGAGRGRGAYYSDDDQLFREYEAKRMSSEQNSILPMNMIGPASSSSSMGGSKDRASQRDASCRHMPLAVDNNINFGSVGGLEEHVKSKEMVVLPLLYPEVFARFDVQPPSGVLLQGPQARARP